MGRTTGISRAADASATIDLAKDNVMLGVRAVDTEGHRSPVAFPSPDPAASTPRR